MKKVLSPFLIIGILLVSACSAPITTPEAETPPISPPTEQQTYTLSISISPSGAGSVFPSSGQYVPSLQVTLAATPASGYTFEYWDGDTSGSSLATTVTMDSDKTVIAHFSVVDIAPLPVTEPEPEPQPSKVPLSYEVVKAYVKEVEGIEEQIIQIDGEETKKVVVIYLTVACVEVKNTDTVPGTFVVYFFVEKPTFGEMSLKVSLDLESNEVKTAQCPADELGAWIYKITPSTKTVIE